MGISIKGTATALATGTTKFKTATAVYLCGHTSATEVTLRNEADDADIGTIKTVSYTHLTLPTILRV